MGLPASSEDRASCSRRLARRVTQAELHCLQATCTAFASLIVTSDSHPTPPPHHPRFPLPPSPTYPSSSSFIYHTADFQPFHPVLSFLEAQTAGRLGQSVHSPHQAPSPPPLPPHPPLLKHYVLFSELHFRSRKRRHAAARSTQVCMCQSLHGQLCVVLCFGYPNSHSLPQRQPSHSDQIFSGQRRRAAGAEQSPRVLRRGALTIN